MVRSTVPMTWLACATLLSLIPLSALDRIGAAQKPPWPNAGDDPLVTPIAGPSWLTHLGVAFDRTSFGRGAGRYGPSSDQKREEREVSVGVHRTVTIGGADLYRLNCQACHRAEGTGAPPEIRSVVDPVQGSSLALVRKQLQQQHPARNETAAARAKASQARADLFARLRKGGQRMPSRAHLREADLDALFAYLTQLAGVPDPERPSQQVVSWARLGEHVVKGTCHICHDAVGPRPTDAALVKGAIPSLESVMAAKPVGEFVRKVRDGAQVLRGDLPLLHRGRMPVFYYLRDEEVAAAYVYLATYPPRPAPVR
jgi:mono/diheme cytochrome c family protein